MNLMEVFICNWHAGTDIIPKYQFHQSELKFLTLALSLFVIQNTATSSSADAPACTRLQTVRSNI